MARDVDVTVDVDGPFFNVGVTSAASAALVHDIKRAVAGQALADIHYTLDRSIRHPTPYYETQITMSEAGGDVQVHDRGVVYGPWLEGTSSRNETTHFKGYSAFRKAAQSVQARVPELVADALRTYVRRLGGGS